MVAYLENTAMSRSSQTVFISGGSRGIGRSIVQHAASQGWNVAFSYLKNKGLAQDLLTVCQSKFPAQKFQKYKLDIKDAEEVETVGEQIVEDFETVDAVICNAGIVKPSNALMMTNEDWQEVIDTNLSGTFYTIRFFLSHFLANRYGRFISLSSIVKNGSLGHANYSASKAGIVGLAKSIAKEFGSQGITSNIIVPGLIETEILKKESKLLGQNFIEQYGPSRRSGLPLEVASVAMFLASSEASYINGAEVHVTGGVEWVY